MKNRQLTNNINQFNHTLHGWFPLVWAIAIPGLPSDNAITMYFHCSYQSPGLSASKSSSVTRRMVGSACEMESQPERAVPAPAWLTTPLHPTTLAEGPRYNIFLLHMLPYTPLLHT